MEVDMTAVTANPWTWARPNEVEFSNSWTDTYNPDATSPVPLVVEGVVSGWSGDHDLQSAIASSGCCQVLRWRLILYTTYCVAAGPRFRIGEVNQLLKFAIRALEICLARILWNFAVDPSHRAHMVNKAKEKQQNCPIIISLH
jgi:hypothetical protein